MHIGTHLETTEYAANINTICAWKHFDVFYIKHGKYFWFLVAVIKAATNWKLPDNAVWRVHLFRIYVICNQPKLSFSAVGSSIAL